MKTYSVKSSLEMVNAKLLRQIDLGAGLAISQWCNFSASHVTYQNPGHHTISFYIKGAVRRTDNHRSDVGSTGVLCLLPADAESSWQVLNNVFFCHIYISQSRLARLAGEAFGRDSRALTLPDLSFFNDEVVTDMIQRVILPRDWSDTTNRPLLAHGADLVAIELLRKSGPKQRNVRLRGGLSPHVLRRVIDLIDSDLSGDLTLGRLAIEAGLSPFHFSRMFKATTGFTPHGYVQDRRLASAESLVRSGKLSMTEISAICGFASASHFAASFKARFGVSPSARSICYNE